MNHFADSGSRERREAALFDQKGNRKYLNAVERKAFLRATKAERDALRRAFCLTLFYTGCRISEALNLTVERIDLADKVIVFETLKRRKRGHFRSVPIPDSLVGLFRMIVTRADTSARVFPNSRATGYRLIKAMMSQAGVTGSMACPKGLRHGFAIACLQQNIPLTTIRKWLGHARLETTAIYLDFVGNEERKFAKRLWKAG